MFKTKTRTFPLGTFVPTPLRIVVIIQLCIGFSTLLFHMGHPFMGKLFEDTRLKKIYESVFNEEEFFQQIPYAEQRQLETDYRSLIDAMHPSFSAKLGQSFNIILVELPPFQKAWIFFSVVIAILILLKIDGAHRAAWILPLIVLVSIGNQWALPQLPAAFRESALFPKEATLLNDYIKEPLASSISEQREQLLKGWHFYVIKEWAKETPSSNADLSARQFSKGLFAFNRARIGAIRQDTIIPSYLRNQGTFFLIAFLIWNVFFAWFVNRRKWFV